MMSEINRAGLKNFEKRFCKEPTIASGVPVLPSICMVQPIPFSFHCL
jgi:hypothetical protein